MCTEFKFVNLIRFLKWVFPLSSSKSVLYSKHLVSVTAGGPHIPKGTCNQVLSRLRLIRSVMKASNVLCGDFESWRNKYGLLHA